MVFLKGTTISRKLNNLVNWTANSSFIIGVDKSLVSQKINENAYALKTPRIVAVPFIIVGWQTLKKRLIKEV